MAFEKIKVILRKLIWFVILLIGIIFSFVIGFKIFEFEVEIINDDGYIIEYYESLNQTVCEIDGTINITTASGDIVVEFYNSNGELLSKQEKYVIATNKTFSEIFTVDGKVETYHISSSSLTVLFEYIEIIIGVFIFIDFIILIFFISSLSLSCRVYHYDDSKIIVYSGRFHHYIKVDGEKMDEHNTLSSFFAIYLSCTLEDGTDINVTITRSGRISLKINNRLYND